MAALQTSVFVLALLSGLGLAASQQMIEIAAPDSNGNGGIYKMGSGSGVSSFASTSGGCVTCNANGVCAPNSFGRGTQTLTCTGQCSATCTSSCDFGDAVPVSFGGQIVNFFPCACPPGACGDPHFVGANGVEFDFHGVPEHQYAIISDANFALSAHMIGQDVAATGFTGTWMSTLGFMYNIAGETHKVAIALEETEDKTTTDVVTVTVDGKKVDLTPAPMSAPGLTLSLTNGVYSIAIEGHMAARVSVDSHKYPNGFHLDFSIDSMHASANAHGVLGQTFQNARAESLRAMAANSTVGSVKSYTDSDVIQGVEADYQISGLFETDFKFNQFVGAQSSFVTVGRKLLTPSVETTEVPMTVNWSGSSLKLQF